MPAEPPATPAVRAAREAEQRALANIHNAANYVYFPDEAQRRIDDALDAYRDAVAARVTAELMASGTPVELDHRDGEGLVDLSVAGRYLGTFSLGGTELWSLTPPGTVHQAVLLMKPEEPNG